MKEQVEKIIEVLRENADYYARKAETADDYQFMNMMEFKESKIRSAIEVLLNTFDMQNDYLEK